MKKRFEIDYKGLKYFFKDLSIRDIKNGKLVKAYARNYIDFFYLTDNEKSKIRLDQVIEYGMPFLVDAIGNDLSVCILTKRRYKLPTGRVVSMKFDRTIIDDCITVYRDYIAGYYVIPDKFIKYI